MIVACGEALVDLMPETVDGETLYRPVLGGSLFNVAMGIARLGGRAGYLWELSTDAFGTALADALAGAGVNVKAVERSDRMTPVAVVDMTGPEPAYNIADGHEVMRRMHFGAIPPGTDVLHIGSAVLARDPMASAIEAVAYTAPLISIDFNVRPPSIDDLETYRARLVRISGRAGLVKASSADLDLLEIVDHEAFVRDLLASGAGLVVITQGPDGASAWSAGGGTSHAPSQVTKLVDPVGAGDAFMAGLLTYLQGAAFLTRDALEGLDDDALQKALQAAQRSAAAVCATKGALMPETTGEG